MNVNGKTVNQKRRLFLAAVLSSPLVAVFNGCDAGETCNACNGSGKNENGVRCLTCNGAGRVAADAPCPLCGGSGNNRMPGGSIMSCDQCRGTGKRNPPAR